MTAAGGGGERVALAAFRAGDYATCVDALDSPSLDSARVAYNRAVAHFYDTGSTDWTALRAAIAPLATDEHVADDNLPLNYTKALLLYRAGRLADARRSLERAFAYRDRIDDAELACRLALLLADVHLACRSPERALRTLEESAPAFRGRSKELRDRRELTELRATLAIKNRVTPAIDSEINDSERESIERRVLLARRLYANGDARGALAELAALRALVDETAAPIVDNNLSLVYAALGKRHLSVEYARRAFDARTKGGDRACYAFNLGVSLLEAERAEDAFEPLVEAARRTPNDPRAWLRLAECCVRRHTSQPSRADSARKIGAGLHAKYALERGDASEYRVAGESYAIPAPSLEFSALCLMNAGVLLNDAEPEQRNAASLLYAYVSLRLNDPSTALEQCSKVLTRSPSPSQCALAHLYSAEALVALDDVAEALEHLNHEYPGEMNAAAKDIVGFAVWLNGAACHAIRGDLAVARNVLHRIGLRRALPLQLYIELCAGNLDNCRVLLRKFTVYRNKV